MKSALEWDVSLALFAPAEVSAITGFSQDLQRVWRRRGHLDGRSSSGMTKLNVRELAEVFVRYRLAVHCVSPSESRQVGQLSANTVLWNALLNTDGACEVIGGREQVELFISEFERDDALISQISGTTETRRFLWSGDCRGFEFAADIALAAESASYVSLVAIDLQGMAARISEMAGKPLFTVRLRVEAGERVRRLTGCR